MLKTLSPRSAATLVAAVLLVIIAGAWAFEYAGYAPCELCLKQRWAYYAGVPFAALLAIFNPRWIRSGLVLLGLVLVANCVFGIYHSGVEWKWWAGPATCSGGVVSDGLPDLSKPAVMCNEAALRILGLSLAGWNAVVCAAMALVAFAGARRSA